MTDDGPSDCTVFARHEVRVPSGFYPLRRLAFGGWQFVFLSAIAWFLYSMADPNYRWIVVDDNIMRARNVAYIGLLLWFFAYTEVLRRQSLGKRELIRFVALANGSVYAETHASWFPWRRRRHLLSSTIDVNYSTMPNLRVWTKAAYPRGVYLKSGKDRPYGFVFGDLDMATVRGIVPWLEERGFEVQYSETVSRASNRGRRGKRRRTSHDGTDDVGT